MDEELERVWGGILSENETKVRAAFSSLDDVERRGVIVHLRRMVDPDEGYSDGQQASARFALAVLLGPAS